MNACGVERQPPRLPTPITRACGQCSSTAGLTRSSIITTAASRSARTALRVSSSGSPGPAPTSQTFALILVSSSGADGNRLGDQQALDFGDAGAAAGAAFELLLEPVQIQPAGNAGADRRLTDVEAVAQGLAGASAAAGRRGERGEQPAAQAVVGAAFAPVRAQPVARGGLAGQA